MQKSNINEYSTKKLICAVLHTTAALSEQTFVLWHWVVWEYFNTGMDSVNGETGLSKYFYVSNSIYCYH